MTRVKRPGEIRSLELSVIDPRIIIAVPGRNCRELNEDHVEQLMASIERDGWWPSQPAEVRYNNDHIPELITCHHRFEAVKRLLAKGVQIEGIPCQVKSMGISEDEMFARNVISNMSARMLDPVEEGEAFQRLAGYQWSMDILCKRFHRSTQYIKDRLELACASVAVKQGIKEGKITIEIAKQMMKAGVNTYQEQAQIIEEAADKKNRSEVKKKLKEKCEKSEPLQEPILTQEPIPATENQEIIISGDKIHSVLTTAYETLGTIPEAILDKSYVQFEYLYTIGKIAALSTLIDRPIPENFLKIARQFLGEKI